MPSLHIFTNSNKESDLLLFVFDGPDGSFVSYFLQETDMKDKAAIWEPGRVNSLPGKGNACYYSGVGTEQSVFLSK
jgi:hypothetical protein